jgi:hypothetical protein
LVAKIEHTFRGISQFPNRKERKKLPIDEGKMQKELS